MDITLAPKLIAAAIVGGTVTASLSRPSAPETVMLQLEWVRKDDKVRSETLHLRAQLDSRTTVVQGDRTVEATPTMAGDGTYLVKLNITDGSVQGEPQRLDTGVTITPGETVVVMGTTRKEGRATKEKLFFLTARHL